MTQVAASSLSERVLITWMLEIGWNAHETSRINFHDGATPSMETRIDHLTYAERTFLKTLEVLT